MNFKKCQLKWKIVKTFTKHTQLTAIRKLFSAPPPPPHPLTRQKDKILLRLWALEKSFSYGDIQKYAEFYFQSASRMQFLGFKKWCSANIFSDREMFAGKFVTWERILTVFREHIIFNVKWVEVRLMSEVFWANLYCKMSDLFR